MYKIALYVPESHLNAVKQALFDAGAGRIGDYEHCCWQTKGQGQFRPLSGSNPYTGTLGEISTIEEYLVELICADEHIKQAINAMINAHPYEEPAYSYWKINSR